MEDQTKMEIMRNEGGEGNRRDGVIDNLHVEEMTE